MNRRAHNPGAFLAALHQRLQGRPLKPRHSRAPGTDEEASARMQHPVRVRRFLVVRNKGVDTGSGIIRGELPGFPGQRHGQCNSRYSRPPRAGIDSSARVMSLIAGPPASQAPSTNSNLPSERIEYQLHPGLRQVPGRDAGHHVQAIDPGHSSDLGAINPEQQRTKNAINTIKAAHTSC